MLTTEAYDIATAVGQSFAQLESQGTLPHAPLRKQALEHFRRLGIPGPKHEEWKYTSMRHLSKGQIDFAQLTHARAQSAEEIAQAHIPNLKANVLSFVNGVYAPYASTILSPIHEVEILDLARAEAKHAFVTEKLGQLAETQNEAFTALNTALHQHGAAVYVPKGKAVELPLVLHYVSGSTQETVHSHPRNLIVLGEQAELTLVETYTSAGDQPAFTNLVSEVFVGAGARLTLIRIQNERAQQTTVNQTHIHQERDSHVHTVTLTLDGGIVRNNLNFYLDGSNIESHLYGLYLADGKTLVDNHTLVDHIKPHSHSNELYKGIAAGKATAVFNGKIFVKQEAQKTNAFQSNRNIILSPDASVNTKPQLEIFADDVKCSHGATIGSLDEEPLFYLRSRGLSLDAARRLLLHAFAGEILQQISPEPVKTWCEALVESRLENLG